MVLLGGCAGGRFGKVWLWFSSPGGDVLDGLEDARWEGRRVEVCLKGEALRGDGEVRGCLWVV